MRGSERRSKKRIDVLKHSFCRRIRLFRIPVPDHDSESGGISSLQRERHQIANRKFYAVKTDLLIVVGEMDRNFRNQLIGKKASDNASGQLMIWRIAPK